MSASPSVRDALRCGFLDDVPAIPANLAWGLVTGVAMAQSGLALPKAYVLSVLAYAGTAQLAALPLLVGHAPVWIIVVTALMVNLRFVIYSAAIAPALAALGRWRRFALSNLIGDIPFVIFMRERDKWPPDLRVPYFTALGLTNFTAWHLGSFAGLIAAGHVAADWNLDFAGMLALVALLVPLAGTWPGLTACAVAGALGTAFQGLPAHAGLLLATLGGVAAALLCDRLVPVRT
jgi:predicted branched-subunit amino acid permease